MRDRLAEIETDLIWLIEDYRRLQEALKRIGDPDNGDWDAEMMRQFAREAATGSMEWMGRWQ